MIVHIRQRPPSMRWIRATESLPRNPTRCGAPEGLYDLTPPVRQTPELARFLAGVQRELCAKCLEPAPVVFPPLIQQAHAFTAAHDAWLRSRP